MLKNHSPDNLQATELAGEPITTRLARTRHNDAPTGGLKFVAENGWFAVRPSATENVYKNYAESFQSQSQFDTILKQVQKIVGDALNASNQFHGQTQEGL